MDFAMEWAKNLTQGAVFKGFFVLDRGTRIALP
jgi:hypothetical protein